jgi:hypothetical protein
MSAKTRKGSAIPLFNVDILSIIIYFIVLFVFFILFTLVSPGGCTPKDRDTIDIKSEPFLFFTSEAITSLEKGSGVYIMVEPEQFRELKNWELMYYLSDEQSLEDDDLKGNLYEKEEADESSGESGDSLPIFNEIETKEHILLQQNQFGKSLFASLFSLPSKESYYALQACGVSPLFRENIFGAFRRSACFAGDENIQDFKVFTSLPAYSEGALGISVSGNKCVIS